MFIICKHFLQLLKYQLIVPITLVNILLYSSRYTSLVNN